MKRHCADCLSRRAGYGSVLRLLLDNAVIILTEVNGLLLDMALLKKKVFQDGSMVYVTRILYFSSGVVGVTQLRLIS